MKTQNGYFFAGAAMAAITPPVGTELLEPRGAPSTGVHDDLFARVLALGDGQTNLAVATLDLIGMDLDLVEEVRRAVWERCRLPSGRLMLNCSHTHSAPITIPWNFQAQERRNRQWEAQAVETIAATVARALEGMAPAALFAGRAEVQIGFNRRLSTPNGTGMAPNPFGPAAPWVDVLRVDRMEEFPRAGPQTLAVLFSHAAHPVTVHIAGTQVSADYPGFACRAVAGRLGEGVQAMFAQGCGGDINVDPLAGGFEAASRAGARLGAAAALAAGQAEPVAPGPIRAISTEISLPFEPISKATAEVAVARARQGLSALEKQGAAPPALDDQRELIAWAEKMLAEAQDGGRGLPFRIQGFALGHGAVLLGLSHEVFVDYQLTLQARSPFPHTLVFGYTNGCVDYIPTAEALLLGGYEVQGGPKYYGQPPLKADCEAIILEAALNALEQLNR